MALAPRPAVPDGARRLAALPDGQTLSGALALLPQDPAGLQAFATAVTSVGSPMAGHYLGRGQFAAEFGPSKAHVDAAIELLRAEHLKVEGVADGGLIVSFSGSARQVGAAFGTTFENYRLANGRVAYAETSAPSVPSTLANIVQTVVGLDDLTAPMPVGPLHGEVGRQKHTPAESGPAEAPTGIGPNACAAAEKDASALGGLTDEALANAYGVDGLYHSAVGGAAETIAVYEEEPFEMTDLRTFDACYFGEAAARKMASRVRIVPVDGGQQVGSGSGEAILDMEDVTAMAPEAHYEVYEAPDTNPGYLDNYAQFVEDDNAQLLTSSWGECEPWDERFLPGFLQVSHVLYEQAAAQGQTVLNAIGDTGSDCMEQFGTKSPILSLTDTGDDPWVLGVGGTTITDATDPPAEQVWNDGPEYGAGGGGISSVWAAPAWQLPFINSRIVAKAEAVSGTDFCGQAECREAPDVSAQADEFTGAITVYVKDYGGWTAFGGTSSSSPLWAGILADIGSTPACQAAGHALGFVPPKLYAIAGNAGDYRLSFNDITEGNNDAYGYADGLYPATAGFDMASGLGSPRVTGPGGANDGLAYHLCHPAGTVPTVTDVDSTTNPGTNSVPASDPGTATVRGSGFESARVGVVRAVTVGGVTARFHVTTPSTLMVVLPSAAAEAGSGAATSGAGTHDVTVTLMDGQTSAPSRAATVVYYSTATSRRGNPIVDDVVTAGSNASGRQPFRIYGSGFVSPATSAGSTPVSVTVGGRAATDVTVVNDSLITADTPPEPRSACLNRSQDTGPGQASFSPAVDTCQVQVQVDVAGHRSPEDPILPEYQGPVADEGAPGSSTESYPGRTELDYLPNPKITSISIATGLASEAGGSVASIQGDGFGELGLSWYNVGPYADYFSANYGFVSVSPTQLIVTIPSQTATTAPVTLAVTLETIGSPNVGALTKSAPSNSKPVTYEPTPTLHAMSVLTTSGKVAPYPAGPTTGGTEVELVGTGFGLAPVAQADSGFAEVAFTDVGAEGKAGGFSDATVTHLLTGSGTEVTFDTVGDDAGIDQVSWCNVSGCTSPLAKGDIFTYYPLGNPSLSSISPAGGTPGTDVVIGGANLGFVEAVYFGPTRAIVFSNGPGLLDCGSTSELMAAAPTGAPGSNVEIRVVTLESEATGFGKSPPNPKVSFRYSG